MGAGRASGERVLACDFFIRQEIVSLLGQVQATPCLGKAPDSRTPKESLYPKESHG